MKIAIAVLVVLMLVMIIINFIDLNRYVLRQVFIKDNKIKKSMKICFLSDLHNCSLKDKFYEDIGKYEPDIIVCGGDIITAHAGKDEKYAYEFMRKIAGIAPVYMALGNHEYRSRIYPEDYPGMYEEFEKVAKECGFHILSNDSTEFEDNNIKISAVEIDRHFYKKFSLQKMEDDYVESLLGKEDEQFYNILLAHNPDYYKAYRAYNPDLVLSGHLHGGLIRLPFINGIAHPGVRFFPNFSGGVYDKNGRFMGYRKSRKNENKERIGLVVSCGIGFHTIPVRLFDPGELIFVTIEPK